MLNKPDPIILPPDLHATMVKSAQDRGLTFPDEIVRRLNQSILSEKRTRELVEEILKITGDATVVEQADGSVRIDPHFIKIGDEGFRAMSQQEVIEVLETAIAEIDE